MLYFAPLSQLLQFPVEINFLLDLFCRHVSKIKNVFISNIFLHFHSNQWLHSLPQRRHPLHEAALPQNKTSAAARFPRLPAHSSHVPALWLSRCILSLPILLLRLRALAKCCWQRAGGPGWRLSGGNSEDRAALAEKLGAARLVIQRRGLISSGCRPLSAR